MLIHIYWTHNDIIKINIKIIYIVINFMIYKFINDPKSKS